MQAIVFPEPGRIELQERPMSACGGRDVRIRVTRAGVCGTDLHIYRHEYMAELPLTPGHEFVGIVDAVGDEVTELAVGERVVVDPNLYCNECERCRRGLHNHCLNWQGVGITRPGAFAQYVSVPVRACYRVPDALDDAAAAWVEPTACVVHAMRRLEIAPGERVLLLGAGPMGLLLMQALSRRGAGVVVVVEPQEQRRRQAERWGVAAVDANDDLDRRLKDLAWPSSGRFDVVVDATGVPAVIASSLRWLGPRGRFMQFGVTPRYAKIEIEPFEVFKQEWSLIGSFALSYDFDAAIEWLARGRLDVGPLVSDVVDFDGFAEAFERFGAGRTMKVHVTPPAV